jgi:predicted DNA-binding transcriptional regulator AlpA
MPDLDLNELPAPWVEAIRKIPAGSLPTEILSALTQDKEFQPNFRIRSADDLVSRKEAAAILGVSVKTFEGWSKKKVGPPIIRLGPKLIRYSVKSLKDFQNGRKE